MTVAQDLSNPPLQPGGDPVWIPEPPQSGFRAKVGRFCGLSLWRPLFTGALLASCYAPLNVFPLAWVAFLPLLGDKNRSARHSAGRLYWAGFWFFLFSMCWLGRVTIGGLVVLSAVLPALYWAPFGLFLHHWREVSGFDSARVNLIRALQGAAIWTGLETLRCHLFTGFTWNTLAVSQVRWIDLIQIADWGGAAAISFIVMVFNLALGAAWLRLRSDSAPQGSRIPREIATPLSLVLLALWYASWRGHALMAQLDLSDPLKAVAVQTNIPQYEKWTEAFIEQNYDVLTGMTRRAAVEYPHADLILWPETAIPDDGTLGPVVRRWLDSLAANGTPILAGALVYEQMQNRVDWYNAAILVQTNGQFVARYDKQHLVMFGEYVPVVFKWLLPFLKKTTEIGEDVTRGTRPVVFPWRGRPHYSVSICFEDTIPGLSREFVRQGARLLINQTNDGWFDPLWGSEQHLANSVLRAVENRVPLYRCANSGISCAVDIVGKVRMRSPARVRGLYVLDAVTRKEGTAPTFYTRHGDLFGSVCGGIGLLTWLLRSRIYADRPARAFMEDQA